MPCPALPQVYISRDEVDAIRSGPDRGLTLLGFKPRSCLRPYHNLRPPTFIYPHDKTVQGSATAFIALWSAMLEVGPRFWVAWLRLAGWMPTDGLLTAWQGWPGDCWSMTTGFCAKPEELGR